MNFMQNPTVLKTISVLSFVVSALFTIQLMTSGTVGITAFIMTSLMAVILEVAKCGFFFKALSDNSINIAMRTTLCCIALLLVGASIFASAGYVTNQANKSKNLQVKSSTQFKQVNEAREIQKQLFEQKKNELSSLQVNKQKTIADMEKIRDSYPKNYITVKENMSYNISKKSSELQNLIDQKSAELSQISSSLQSPVDMSKLNVSETKGYSAMFKILAEKINSSEEYQDKPVTSDELEMWFFISLGVIFELVAILTAYLSQKELGVKIRFKPKELETCQSSNVSDFQNRKFTVKKNGLQAKKSNIVNFTPKKEVITPKESTTSANNDNSIEFSDEDLQRYMEYMFGNSKNGNAPGYIKIGRESGIGVKKAEKIKAYLEMAGVVKVIGNRTMIIKEA